MRQSKNIERVRQEADPVGEKFIEADLEIAMTFLQIAQTEFGTGNHERAAEVLAKAERAYEAIARFLPKIAHSERKRDLQRKCRKMRETMKEIKNHHLGKGR